MLGGVDAYGGKLARRHRGRNRMLVNCFRSVGLHWKVIEALTLC